LFGDRHIKLIVGHAALASKVITDEIAAGWDKNLPHLRMKPGCVVLVAQFVNSLKRHHDLESA